MVSNKLKTSSATIAELICNKISYLRVKVLTLEDKMRILILGATGFLGSNVIRLALEDENINIFGSSRSVLKHSSGGCNKP
jgi:hypothetical protein